MTPVVLLVLVLLNDPTINAVFPAYLLFSEDAIVAKIMVDTVMSSKTMQLCIQFVCRDVHRDCRDVHRDTEIGDQRYKQEAKAQVCNITVLLQ